MKEKGLLQYIGIISLVVLSYIIYRVLGAEQAESIIKFLMPVSVASLFLVLLFYCKKQSSETTVYIIIWLGMIMRICYMLYTDCNVRIHDLFEIDINAKGHAGYLLTLLEKHHLPESNELQLYQAPFFYMTGALFSGLINGILNSDEWFYLVDASKTVSCAASCISLIVCKKIYEVCDMPMEEQKNAILVVAFLPAAYLTGGRVGPDALAGMFMTLAFLYTIRFMKEPTWKNIIILAIIYGFGVMTKISCAVLALITAMMFLWKLYEQIKKRKVKKIILQYIVFGIISLPLGLWYSVRNYVLFQQPLNYVLDQSGTPEIHTGMYSVTERFIGIDIANWLRSPYANVWEDYNAPIYYLKSALFGEFTYDVPGWVPVLLLLCATVVAIAVVVALIWQFIWNRKDIMGMVSAGTFLIYYISVIWFYYKYPFGCSMDFRYMIFCVIPISIVLGKYSGVYKQRWIHIALWGEALSSCLMYCLIM